MIRYTTVAKEAHVEQTIERSRFIGHIKHIESKEEFEAFREEIRRDYPGADHNVPAYILGEKMELMWNSDRGEPAGTAGPPIMQMLQREGVTNVCCIVTRYFGGILLGKGGLVRAYTSTAKMALDAAGKHDVKDSVLLEAEIGYSYLQKIQNISEEYNFVLEKTDYTDIITIALRYEAEEDQRILSALSNATNGSIIIKEKNFEII